MFKVSIVNYLFKSQIVLPKFLFRFQVSPLKRSFFKSRNSLLHPKILNAYNEFPVQTRNSFVYSEFTLHTLIFWIIILNLPVKPQDFSIPNFPFRTQECLIPISNFL
jgi:hypothetical protein